MNNNNPSIIINNPPLHPNINNNINISNTMINNSNNKCSVCYIVDNGEYQIKCGLGGEIKPNRLLFNNSSSSILNPLDSSYSLNNDNNIDIESQIDFLHNECFNTGNYPNYSPSDSLFFLSDSLSLSPSQRLTMDEIIMEKYNYSGYYRCSSDNLIIRGYQYDHQSLIGNPLSLIIDCGHTNTRIIPLFNYTPIYSSIRIYPIGGKSINNYLYSLLSLRYPSSFLPPPNLYSDIKHKYCYLSLDYNRQLKNIIAVKQQLRLKSHPITHPIEKVYNFQVKVKNNPQNNNPINNNPVENNDNSNNNSIINKSITLLTETIQSVEPLFQPQLISEMEKEKKRIREMGNKGGQSSGEKRKRERKEKIKGLAEMVVESIESCDSIYRGLLYKNIVLSGGSAIIPNFIDRLTKAIEPLIDTQRTIKINKTNDPISSAWTGGSCLSLDPVFPSLLITNKQYKEEGKKIFNKFPSSYYPRTTQ